MTNAVIITAATDYRTAAIDDGYIYECACGELYKMAASALCCRKCRNYCVFGYCTHVVDITSGEVVAGTEPTAEEYEEMRALAEARWEADKAEMEFWRQMRRQEGELYEAEMVRQAEEAHVAAMDLAEDIAYSIQDELMGY